MRKWRDVLIERLRNDPVEAENYLKASLEEFEEDNNTGAFLLAVRALVEAKGGMNLLSQKTHLNRTQLYRMLSAHGNPTLISLNKVLPELGLRLTVTRDDR